MPRFTVIIPARYAASRLPGKLLLDLAGKPVIQRVIDQAIASGADQVIVATDDPRIELAAKNGGAQVVMTAINHPSGTDRIAQAARILALPDDEIIINVQGDEPDMPTVLIQQMASALADRPEAQMCTSCSPITEAETLNDPNIVKVVRDAQDYALYFSRAPIAYARDARGDFPHRRHLGIYAYRAAYVIAFSAANPCALEQTEKLEQLRALYRGDSIYCPDAIEAPGIGIDTEADINRARKMWR